MTNVSAVPVVGHRYYVHHHPADYRVYLTFSAVCLSVEETDGLVVVEWDSGVVTGLVGATYYLIAAVAA